MMNQTQSTEDVDIACAEINLDGEVV